MPISYLELERGGDRIYGTLTVHADMLAAELGFDEARDMVDSGVLDAQDSPVRPFLAAGLRLTGAADQPLALASDGYTIVGEGADMKLRFHALGPPPAALHLAVALFAQVPDHQTFVTIREGGAIVQQFMLSADTPPQVNYAGTAAGAWAVAGTFIPSGAWHVLIGPDHVLFVIGLILLGGSVRRLALIVTAFTLGHSVTLALAATGTLSPPEWLVEPLIALTIVVVGADNLLRKQADRDLRPWFAVLFGLIHGFGFAFVLRDFGLPPGNLAVSLLAFNLGVEIGQLAIVVPVALALAAIRRRDARLAMWIARGGSLAVVAAGLYWFVDRVLSMGSV
ncbi:hypothetical protein GCM10011411_02580 [Aurantiacibacter arachoides]|nr:hypothetical protein GCM10011411_02580 [Aurantiacibacter arachoides]